MSDDREVKFWDCSPDTERLSHTTITEAVEAWADDFALDGEEGDKLPETVEVYGFAPMALPSANRLAELALEYVLEWLDEDFSDPEGDPTEPSDEMKAAALTFANAIFKEYPMFMCEQVAHRVVTVADYCAPSSPEQEAAP